jgi:hypothetical protein
VEAAQELLQEAYQLRKDAIEGAAAAPPGARACSPAWGVLWAAAQRGVGPPGCELSPSA